MRLARLSLLLACSIAGAFPAAAAGSAARRGAAARGFLPGDRVRAGGAVSAAWLNDHAAGSRGRVRVREGGRLELEGRRLRFFGINSGWLPERDDAPELAARLAELGINIVRFHHIDAPWQYGLLSESTGKGPARIDPAALDRLDFFVAELAKAGIYSNLNLLTGRLFTAADGLPASIDGIDDFKVRHSLGFIDSRLVDLQKGYARDLLLHVNPYRGLSYAKDPAVAVVEINNENGALMSWLNGWLDRAPDDFSAEWRRDWNRRLRGRYGTDEALIRALGLRSPPGAEMLGAPDAQGGAWSLERHAGARADLRALPAGGLAVDVREQGTEGWHVQLSHPGLRLEAGRAYTLGFRARALPGGPRRLDVDLSLDGEPWSNLGFSASVDLEEGWRDYRLTIARAEAADKARLVLGGLGLQRGGVEIADVSLRPGADLVPAGAALAEDGWPPLRFSERGSCPGPLLAEWLGFLRDLDDSYWSGMEAFLRDELRVEALLAGTVLGCAMPSSLLRFDIVDAHAYWNHPAFPGVPWDETDSYAENTSLARAADGGTLAALAGLRVKGKPFSVSEYDHPWPNQRAAEGWPMAAAFASFQDWDMLYAFSLYAEKAGEGGRIQGYFDQLGHPVKAAALPFAARIFRQGLVPPSDEEFAARASVEVEVELAAEQDSGWALFGAGRLGVDAAAARNYRLSLDFSPGAASADLAALRKANAAAQSVFDGRRGASGPDAAGGRGKAAALDWRPAEGTFIARGPSALVAVHSPGPKGSTLSIPAADGFPGFSGPEGFAVLAALRDPPRPGEPVPPVLVYSARSAGNDDEDLREYPVGESRPARAAAPAGRPFDLVRPWPAPPGPKSRARAEAAAWRIDAEPPARVLPLDAQGRPGRLAAPGARLDASLWYVLE